MDYSRRGKGSISLPIELGLNNELVLSTVVLDSPLKYVLTAPSVCIRNLISLYLIQFVEKSDMNKQHDIAF